MDYFSRAGEGTGGPQGQFEVISKSARERRAGGRPWLSGVTLRCLRPPHQACQLSSCPAPCLSQASSAALQPRYFLALSHYWPLESSNPFAKASQRCGQTSLASMCTLPCCAHISAKFLFLPMRNTSSHCMRMLLKAELLYDSMTVYAAGNSAWARVCTAWRQQNNAEDGQPALNHQGTIPTRNIFTAFGAHERNSCPMATLSSIECPDIWNVESKYCQISSHLDLIPSCFVQLKCLELIALAALSSAFPITRMPSSLFSSTAMASLYSLRRCCSIIVFT